MASLTLPPRMDPKVSKDFDLANDLGDNSRGRKISRRFLFKAGSREWFSMD